jgi:hypothetical protein
MMPLNYDPIDLVALGGYGAIAVSLWWPARTEEMVFNGVRVVLAWLILMLMFLTAGRPSDTWSMSAAWALAAVVVLGSSGAAATGNPNALGLSALSCLALMLHFVCYEVSFWIFRNADYFASLRSIVLR